jgi:hypothetical protein
MQPKSEQLIFPNGRRASDQIPPVGIKDRILKRLSDGWVEVWF